MFKYEDDEWFVINYVCGVIVLINIQVMFVSFGKNSFIIKFIDSGMIFKIENVEKYIKCFMFQFVKEMFVEKLIFIEKYGKEMEEVICIGMFCFGMIKMQVLFMCGYLFGYEIFLFDFLFWKYWNVCFVIYSFVFDGDILSKVCGVD